MPGFITLLLWQEASFRTPTAIGASPCEAQPPEPKALRDCAFLFCYIQLKTRQASERDAASGEAELG